MIICLITEKFFFRIVRRKRINGNQIVVSAFMFLTLIFLLYVLIVEIFLHTYIYILLYNILLKYI